MTRIKAASVLRHLIHTMIWIWLLLVVVVVVLSFVAP
jgi:hypothetical protein